jgi:hypothetical protein
MILMEEFRRLDVLLAQTPSTVVLIDKCTFALQGQTGRDRGLRMLVELLQKRYEIEAITEYSYLFARRPDGGLLLGEDDGAAFHVGFRDGAAEDGLSFLPFAPKSPWSLELVVKPEAMQGAYATLVGNHPGKRIGGFVIHQETPGLCALVVGDGKAWQRLLQFNLRPGEWNYLALVRTEDAFTVYLDGQPVASRAVPGLQMEDSPLPLQIGNWIGKNRRFNGDFKEVRISKRALTADEIAAAAESVRGKSALPSTAGLQAEAPFRDRPAFMWRSLPGLRWPA